MILYTAWRVRLSIVNELYTSSIRVSSPTEKDQAAFSTPLKRGVPCRQFYGAYTYEELVEWARTAESELDALAADSPLPKKPDRDAVGRLLMDMQMQMQMQFLRTGKTTSGHG